MEASILMACLTEQQLKCHISSCLYPLICPLCSHQVAYQQYTVYMYFLKSVSHYRPTTLITEMKEWIWNLSMNLAVPRRSSSCRLRKDQIWTFGEAGICRKTWIVMAVASTMTCKLTQTSSTDYTTNPYPLRNCIIPNEATASVQEPRIQRTGGSWSPSDC